MESQGPRTIDLDQFRRQRPPVRTIAIGLLVMLAVILAFSVFFTIQPEEVGVVLRFGRFVRTAEPGLNLKLPSPIEQVLKVPVQRQLKQEFGFETIEAGVRTRYSDRDLEGESLMLTGDLNVAVVEWIAQYRVDDPYKYLFKVRNVTTTFRDMNEAVMRAVIGDRSVDEVITIGRLEIEDEVKVKLQAMCDRYETGIVVDQIVLQDVNPPDPVKPSFNEVNQAEQERERAINDARAGYNRIIPKARGQAQETIQQAEGYALDRVNRARGDAALFDEVLAAYRRAPEVTRRRIYLETMEAVYPGLERKLVLDDDLSGVLPLLDLKTTGGGQ
ncbi:MAG: FtsH protease activity modulator HflK [Thermoanaerobaculales bacterium]|jgi:membrane protease subunit HflK|nr:FtsH protease activity modulator HflK [Thermoanaerobaculales bacterium]